MTVARCGRAGAATLVAAVAILAGFSARSPASHNTFERVSIGVTGGNGALPAPFEGASADGTLVFLRTEEQLTASDTDSEFDLYENAGGTISQLSLGPAGGNSPFVVAQFRGSSLDGARVFFNTAEPLVSADQDDCIADDPGPNGCTDVYERAGGVTTLISVGPAATNDRGASFEGASESGATVFFRTEEGLVASDTDGRTDVYERSGGTTKLVSTGSTGGNGSLPAFFRGAAADGSRILFATAEQLVAGDTDGSSDVYERAGGATTLVSTGSAGGNGAFEASFRGVTRAGTQVFFETAEHLTAADTDSSIDVYERSGGATTLVSTGPAGGNGAPDAHFKEVSEGGSRVFFQTAERLTGADTDSAIDVYERSGGATTLLSTGPAGGNGAVDALLQDVSSDGATVVIGTVEPLTSGDTDNRFDLYARTSGVTTLVTTGPGGDFDAFFDGMSRDGRRIFFHTLEQLSDDSDLFPDVYERADGVTTKLSDGPNGGDGPQIAVFVGTSDDGARVFYSTLEKLVSSDTDSNVDLYVARIVQGYPRPKGATPTLVQLVPAYRPCTSPNRLHGPPPLGGTTPDPSCTPPVQVSEYLTVGTADANGKPTKSMGYVRYSTRVGDPGTSTDEADVLLAVSLTDVRRKTDLEDYTGQLQADATIRVTDKYNGSSPVDPATMSELSLPAIVPCVATADTTIGATCSVDTSVDALVPGAIKEGTRAVWQIGQVEVQDGGADGQAATSPNTVFAKQGLFIP